MQSERKREKLERKNTKGYLLKGWKKGGGGGGREREVDGRRGDETARWMKKVWSLRGRRREG